MRKRRSPLEWSHRSPYVDNRLGFPFEVGGPVSRSVTKWEAICPDYYEYPMILGPTSGARPRSSNLPCTPSTMNPLGYGLGCPSLPRLPDLRIRSSGPLAGRRCFWQVGPTW
jgi:hypothetical protein